MGKTHEIISIVLFYSYYEGQFSSCGKMQILGVYQVIGCTWSVHKIEITLDQTFSRNAIH